jgi:hypothetical protein
LQVRKPGGSTIKTDKLSSLLLSLAVLLTLIAWSSLTPSSAAEPSSDWQTLATNDVYADLAIGIPGRPVESGTAEGAASVLSGTNGGLTATDSQYLNQFNTGGGESPESYDEFGKALAAGDFDGDGFVDLAIGVPGESIAGENNVGAVHVLYGTADGYSSSDAQLWSHDTLPGQTVAENEQFGAALASGDFNGDTFDDLAIGVPEQDLLHLADIGTVNVLYGSANGLVDTEFQVFAQGIAAIEDAIEAGDQFGQVLAVGNFNGDAYHDLAIGVRHEDIGTTVDAGAVHVIYGSADGLSYDGDQFWVQGGYIQDTPEAFDSFGYALAAGDFDGDGNDDLAIGVPYEYYLHYSDGVVHVLWGSQLGLSGDGNQLWRQDLLDEASEPGDRFGAALAAGDFDGDGHDDLAIGVPYETLEGTTDIDGAGVVHVLYGSGSPFAGEESDLFTQDLEMEQPESFDCFGHTLASGDFDNNGWDDLAIGVPYEDSDTGKTNTGVVHIFFGSDHGLSTALDQQWDLHYSTGLDPSAYDKFGYALVALITPEMQHVYLPLVVK